MMSYETNQLVGFSHEMKGFLSYTCTNDYWDKIYYAAYWIKGFFVYVWENSVFAILDSSNKRARAMMKCHTNHWPGCFLYDIGETWYFHVNIAVNMRFNYKLIVEFGDCLP